MVSGTGHSLSWNFASCGGKQGHVPQVPRAGDANTAGSSGVPLWWHDTSTGFRVGSLELEYYQILALVLGSLVTWDR